jgi:hypothetical protein
MLNSRPLPAHSMTATETATISKDATETVIPSYFDAKKRQCLFEAEPKQNQLGDHGTQGSFVNSKGLQIATYYWPVRRSSSGCSQPHHCMPTMPMVP